MTFIQIFYTADIVFFFVAIAVDIVLRGVLKIRHFGIEKELIPFRGKNIPIEDFLPKNLSLLAVYGFSFGAFGAIYQGIGLHWVLSIIFGLLSGLWVMFFINHWFQPLKKRILKLEPPKNYLQSGMEAVCCQAIDEGGYGRIMVKYRDMPFYYTALSANGSGIEKGERVIIVYGEQGIWWVEKEDEAMTVDS